MLALTDPFIPFHASQTHRHEVLPAYMSKTKHRGGGATTYGPYRKGR